MTINKTGQCLCGLVSFKLTAEPLTSLICWCRDCQHLSANGMVSMFVPAGSLTVTGTLSEYTKTADSGNLVSRQFCPNCGTHLFAKLSAWPQLMVVRAGNLDEPSSVQPTMNIWAASAPSWACLNPELERMERQPLPASQQSSNGQA
jgi:hypothetical protein